MESLFAPALTGCTNRSDVSGNIAVIEQEANEALSENRRELAEESTKINREPDLSEEAKARYVGEARERAQAKYAERALLKTQDA